MSFTGVLGWNYCHFGGVWRPYKATKHHTRLKKIVQGHTKPYKAIKGHSLQFISYCATNDTILPQMSLYELHVFLTSYRPFFVLLHIFCSTNNLNIFCSNTNIFVHFRMISRFFYHLWALLTVKKSKPRPFSRLGLVYLISKNAFSGSKAGWMVLSTFDKRIHKSCLLSFSYFFAPVI